MATLMDAGLLHSDILTVAPTRGLDSYRQEPILRDGELSWRDCPAESLDPEVLAPVAKPFSADGGLKVLDGNLGRSIIKVSAVKPEHRVVEAPAILFNHQNELEAAFKLGKLEQDFIAVIRFQGPRANGMPELHKLTPVLGSLQGKGFKVAIVTDGRMSGASGKVPAAIHITPECLNGGPLARVRAGDMIRLDANAGTLDVLVDEAELLGRIVTTPDLAGNAEGMGRELFSVFRANAGNAEEGASSI
jgi:phosphogluconate dehydratase